MKKIFLIILLFISLGASAQYFPVNGSFGAPTSSTYFKGIALVDTAFRWRYSYPDTATANAGNVWRIAGAVIRVGTNFYVRNETINRWVQLGDGGGTVNTVTLSSFLPLFATGVGGTAADPSFTFSAISKSGNVVFASPANGSSGAPDFRALVAADLPSGIYTAGTNILINGSNVITTTDSIQIRATGEQPYMIRHRVIGAPFPVATIKPSGISNLNFAMDFGPSGFPGNSGDNGIAWGDMVDRSVEWGSGPVRSARWGITDTSAQFGARWFGGATAMALEFVMSTTTVMKVRPTSNSVALLTTTRITDTTGYDVIARHRTSGDLRMIYAGLIGGGGTPTLQQVFATQSNTAVMTASNTINNNGNEFTITGGNIVRLNNKIGAATRYAELLIGEPSDINMVAYNGDMQSTIYVVPDSIAMQPHLGKINIDTLRAATTQTKLLGWGDAGNGMVGSVTIGAGLSLSSGTLTATASGTVTSFAFTDGSGFDGTVTNSTTTPTLALTTTVTDNQVMTSNSGAISGSTALTFDENQLKVKAASGISNLRIEYSGGTTIYQDLSIDGSGNSIFNSQGADLIFRRSGTNVLNMSVNTFSVLTGISLNVDNNSLFVNQSTNSVGIGTASPTSLLHTTGSFATAYVAKTATYTATISDRTIEATANTFTITLPTAVGITGRQYVITNSGAGVVTLATTSSQTFANVVATPTTLTLNQFATVTVESNGANWLRVTSL